MVDAFARAGEHEDAEPGGEAALQQLGQRALEGRRQQVVEADLGHRPGCRAVSLRLVMFGYEALEQSDAEPRRTLRHGRRVLFRPRGAGNVEMGPWRLVDEALEELRGGDAAAVAAAADVPDVRRVAVELAVVGFGERHAPERLADRLARSSQPLGELVIVGE